MVTRCTAVEFGICLTTPPASPGDKLFGFPEFLTALALLVLVFNSTGGIYRFRLAVSAVPMKLIAFAVTAIAGIGTLVTDLWFAMRWPALPWGVPRVEIQACFAIAVLIVVLAWTWTAFLRAASFSRWNARRFHGETLRATVTGSDEELRALALELPASAAALTKSATTAIARASRHRAETREPRRARRPETADYADEILRMLGNRRLCRIVAMEVPAAAMAIMHEAAGCAVAPPVADFARNVTEAALADPDTILFNEDPLRAGDYLATVRPFMTSMYGDWRLVEALATQRSAPFDIDWRMRQRLDGEQMSALVSAILMTIGDYVRSAHYGTHSYAIARAFGDIGSSLTSLAELEGMSGDFSQSRSYAQAHEAVRLVQETLTMLEERATEVLRVEVGRAPRERPATLLDRIVELAFELVHAAGYVSGPHWTNWSIQHNLVWNGLTSSWDRSTGVRPLFERRLFRILFDEVKEMERLPNYKGARILGFLLNVLGVDPTRVAGLDRRTAVLKRAIVAWTRRRWATMRVTNPQVADAVLVGGISFDEEGRRLVKRYSQGTAKEPEREFLDLDPPIA